MNNMFIQVLEFGEILCTPSKKNKKSNLFLIAFILLFTNQNFSQTIPGKGSNGTTCGDCTPTGWLDFNGTPDISNRNIAGGQGTIGAEATWVNAPLPIPPTGDITWITMKDLGGLETEESVRTTMGNLEAGKLYRLTIFTKTAISNQKGGTANNQYYGGTFKQKFDYQVGQNAANLYPRQVISTVSQNK